MEISMHDKIKEINQSMGRVSNLYEQWAKQNNINYLMLLVFYSLKNGENMTQKKIRLEHRLLKQTVNNIIVEMEKNGYVELKVDSSNKREKIVTLTEKGKAYTEEIIDPLLMLEESLINKLGIEKIDSLIEITTLFGDTLQEEMQNYLSNK